MGQVCSGRPGTLVHPEREGGADVDSLSGSGPRQRGVAEPRLQIRPEGHAAWWDLREVWEFRDLWFALAARDLRLRYRQTFLGVLWVVFQPLAGAGVFAFVFGTVLGLGSSPGTASAAGAGSANTPSYFLFSLVGTLLWTAFSSTFSKSSMALLGNASLVAKVYFPRLLLPLATLLSTLVDLGIGGAAFGTVAFWQGVRPPWEGWVFFFLWAGIAALTALGVGLMASALMSRLRDIQHVLPLLLPFLMYASPVGYPLERVPSQWKLFFELNPLTWALEGGRAALLGTPGISGRGAVGCVMVSITVLVLGVWVYRRLEKGVSDVL